MPGRPPKPRPVSAQRSDLINQLRSDIGNYRARTEREAMEEKLGRRLNEPEWHAIQDAERDRAE